jgi:hypothetical protein
MGGLYSFQATATWGGGNVQIQQLSGDGSTLVNIGTNLTANGQNTIYLPPGSFKLLVTTATAVYASLIRVPFD